MKLCDVRDYVASLGLADPKQVYSGKLDARKEKSIGVYNSKHTHDYKTAIGGPELESYGMKYVTLLVHWNKSQRETEETTSSLFKVLQTTREVQVNNKTIKFIQPLYEPQDVGTDDDGIYEMVIEVAVVYSKKG